MFYRSLLSLGLVPVVAGLLVSGCAKKKDMPPRGEVIAPVGVATNALNHSRLEPGVNCFQAVKLADSSNVVEVSEGACNGQLASSVIATIQIHGKLNRLASGSELLLAMGEGSRDEQTPVGYIRNIAPVNEPSQYEIQALCSDRTNDLFSAFCQIEANSQGGIVKINLSNSMTVAGLQFNRLMETRSNLVKLAADLAAFKKELGLTSADEGSLRQKLQQDKDALAASATEEGKLRTKIGEDVAEIGKQFAELKKAGDKLIAEMKKSAEDTNKESKAKLDALIALQTQIRAEMKKLMDDNVEKTLSDLIKQIDSIKASMKDIEDKKVAKSLEDMLKAIETLNTKFADLKVEDKTKVLDALIEKSKKINEDLQKALDISKSKDLDGVTEKLKAIQVEIDKLITTANDATSKSESAKKLAAEAEDLAKKAQEAADKAKKAADEAKAATDKPAEAKP